MEDSGVLIALADDHPIVRVALRAALAGLATDTRFVEASDAASTLELVKSAPDIDLLLMDLHMPGVEGLATVRAIRETVPQLPVAIVSADEDTSTVAGLLRLGVCGFIPKSDSAKVIVSAVRLILAGGTYVPPRLVNASRPAPSPATSSDGNRLPLTDRQFDVLRLLGKGKSNKLIARELGITEGTVKVHVKHILKKLNLRSRLEAAVWALEHKH